MGRCQPNSRLMPLVEAKMVKGIAEQRAKEFLECLGHGKSIYECEAENDLIDEILFGDEVNDGDRWGYKNLGITET